MAQKDDLAMIRAISPEHAHAILIYLCDNSRILKKARAYVPRLAIQAPGAVDARKRKAALPLAICVQCGDCFVEGEDRLLLDCCYHSGELEVDWDGDFWADHDENCHGPIDTEENREDYPEGFFWTCCDKPGDTLGCRKGKHQADRTKSKKGSFLDEFSYAEKDSSDEEADECHKVVPAAVSRHLAPTKKTSDASSSGKQIFGGASTSVENSPPVHGSTTDAPTKLRVGSSLQKPVILE
ncbi:hypothetical protein BHE90_016676 [Fusarium euwallaceae]|uniref:C2H2-type domain-containing protein n=1 Tax=Fusarium euwallaceae TaxID=1147111 RepID=A0A430KZT4_9HYPO|nr:hypothetical protein BHE90_016676 [Fusarium euwallaceae]